MSLLQSSWQFEDIDLFWNVIVVFCDNFFVAFQMWISCEPVHLVGGCCWCYVLVLKLCWFVSDVRVLRLCLFGALGDSKKT